MFNSIAAGIEEINEMFGTSIEVKKPEWLGGVSTEEEVEVQEEEVEVQEEEVEVQEEEVEEGGEANGEEK